MAGEKSIHSGHRQRMRERFSGRGFLGYQPHEVLEQFLYDVIPRGDTNETAHLLLQKFGSLDGVLPRHAKSFSLSKESARKVRTTSSRSIPKQARKCSNSTNPRTI